SIMPITAWPATTSTMPNPLAAATRSLRAALAAAGALSASLDAVDSGGALSIAPPSRHIDRPRAEAQPTAPTRRVLRRECAARHIDRIARRRRQPLGRRIHIPQHQRAP